MLAAAWLLGEGFNRIGQPAVVGQILGGVLIGPSVLNLVQSSETGLGTVENVALFFIMLLTGFAVRPAKVIAAGKRGAIISTIAFVLPFIAGFEIARLFGVGLTYSLTVGLTISITAVPVNSLIMMELGLLDTDLGATVIAAGVIDDILSFIALGLIEQFANGGAGGDASVFWAVLKVVVFLGAFFLCEHFVRTNAALIRVWTNDVSAQFRTPGSYIAVLIIIAVGLSLLAEWAGLQLVIGAFFSGLLLSEVTGDEKLEKATDVVRGVTFGFFAPIAFTYIGTELLLSSLTGKLLLLCTLLVAAIVTKLAGGYLGARLSKFTSPESIVIGFLMNSRGFVELVIASTAYQIGLIDQTYFSMVVGIGIITTIISPVASRFVIKRANIRGSAPSPASGDSAPE